MLRLSLIIPTYNRPKDIMRLLRNLNLQTRKPDEVIIVDASDTEETKMLVEHNKEEFTYPISYYSHEKGLTRQRNYGVSKARYDIVGFTDDDSLFEPDYFARILNIFEKDLTKEIGGASGSIVVIDHTKITVIDERLREIVRKEEFSTLMKDFFSATLTTHRPKMRQRIEKILFMHSVKEGTYCSTNGRFCFLKTLFRGQKVVDFLPGIAFYRKDIFNSVRYSDFFQGYSFGEDVHFSLQVGKRYSLLVDGEAVCYHLHAPSGRPDLFKIGYMYSRNHFYIFKTYKKHNKIDYFIFWYSFCLNAILDVMPAFIGKNSVDRFKLFFGQIYGAFSSLTSAPIE
jgi:glycosyltransferase involved in cell wall biosynthesis